MSVIADTSQKLIETIKSLCGDQLVEVTEHPGQWDESSVARIVRNPPAAYVAWLGHTKSDNPKVVKATWAVFLVANVLDGQRENQTGIYQLVEILSAGLHRKPIPPSGTFELQSVKNLWSDTQSGMGVAVYGMYFNAAQPNI
ncbi:DUF1834 family protein [Pasteurella multocida]|uniref:phage protein Gp37 n=1 Tax=Pasteurella multocida TaxID=747 RepID=UPI0029B92497|nr:phage protein Gp37 [Pasteurella multocida]MDX3962151.1 DUF1834 family protein [Pasteurella multocida]